MSLILDTGALLALERGDVATWQRLEIEERAGRLALTHGGVLAQAWRGGDRRQALLARALPQIKVVPLDEELGRAAGVLLGRSATSDASDAAVVALARRGDRIQTSDPADIEHLIAAAGLDVTVIPW